MKADLTQLQVDFLASLARMEERVDNKRRIDVDPNFQDEVIEDAKTRLGVLFDYRAEEAHALKFGKSGNNAETLRQAVVVRCRDDILYWIDHFAFILNPHLTKYGFPMKVPFVLFPKQREYILWREDLYKRNKSGLVYKCREVGVSWMNVAVQCYHFIFEPGFQGRVASLKADEVDSTDNPDTLFHKFRTILYNLPIWMRHEELFEPGSKHDTKMKLVNPANGAVVAGQQGDNIGRGGRSAIMDLDEWAKIDHARMVDSALSMNTSCRIYTGTPMGRDNDYAEKLTKKLIPVFEFNYWDDPRKTPDWFQNFSDANPEEIVKQEVLKSLDAFKGGTLIKGEWVSASKTLYDRIKSGEVKYEPTDKACGLDVAAGGKDRSVLVPRDGIVVEEPTEWNLDNTTMLTRYAASTAEEFGANTVNFDPISCGVGVKSTFELESFAFNAIPVDYRGAASEVPIEGRPARAYCLNRRAELAVRLAKRFELTYEYIAKGIEHPIDDMIAVCGNQKLANELSIPEKLSQGAKWRLESKEAMAKRGIDSPDYFDACVLAFANEMSESRVVSSFNRGVVVEPPPPQIILSQPGVQHFVSVFHARSLSAAALGAVWNGATLTIYGEICLHNPTVPQMCTLINRFFRGEVYEYVGNNEMFSQGQDDLFMEYMQHNVLLIQNFLYNEMSAVASLNEMVDKKMISISASCKSLISQMETFERAKGAPDKLGMEVVLCLCNLLARLKDVYEQPEAGNPIMHYNRKR